MENKRLSSSHEHGLFRARTREITLYSLYINTTFSLIGPFVTLLHIVIILSLGHRLADILQFVTSSPAQKVPLPGSNPLGPVSPCQPLSSNTKPYQPMNRQPYNITHLALAFDISKTYHKFFIYTIPHNFYII